MVDEQFLDQVQCDPSTALAEYDLNETERHAIERGDCEEILRAAGRTDKAKWIIVIVSANMEAGLN
jgi:hypothetical protein